MTPPSKRSKAVRKRVRPPENFSEGRSATTERSDRPLSFFGVLCLITVVALLLRLVHVLQTVEVPTTVQLIGDAKGYHDWALRIAGGQWYGEQTFYQAPLYPYLLAVLIKFLSAGILGIRLFQAVLGAASVMLLGLATKRMFGVTAGWTAAAMYALFPAAFYFDGIIQKTALASFLLAALLAAITQYQQSPQLRWSATIGAILGLLVLTRENALLWIPVIPCWIAFGFDSSRRQRAISIACYVGGLAVVLLPVAARNASLGGEWSPTTFQAGPNFYIGNNLESNGLYRPLVPGHETPFYERADAERLAEQAEGRELTSRQVSRFWFDRSFEEIRSDPVRWLQLMLTKSLMVINHYEVPDVESLTVFRDYSWPLRAIAPWWHFGVLFPLSVWGLVASWDRRRVLWPYYLLIVVMIAAIVLFFILGRYRQPLVLLLVPFAAAGLIDIVDRIRQRTWRGSRVSLIAALIAAVLTSLPVHDESSLEASSYMNMGIAAGQAGNLRISIEALSHAVREHPEMVEAHFNLARALELGNRPREALVYLRNAQQLDPSLVMVDAIMGRIYERLGDYARAADHYRRAIEIDPQDTESRQALERLIGR